MNLHSQPERRGHDIGPFKRQEKDRAKKKKNIADARTLPETARRAGGFLRNIRVLKEKVSWQRLFVAHGRRLILSLYNHCVACVHEVSYTLFILLPDDLSTVLTPNGNATWLSIALVLSTTEAELWHLIPVI